MLGLGTLLITELPRQPGRAASLISTALIVVGGMGGCVGVVFALAASYASAGFKPLGASIVDIIIFAAGVSLTAITLVLDSALVGLLHGELQFWRNTLFAVAKLILLFVVSYWLSGETGITIYVAWAVGNLLSLVALTIFIVLKKRSPKRNYIPQWGFLRKSGFAAFQHHLLNLTLQAPILILPLLVTVLLSATMNAWFYVSWMIASFVFLIPNALTIVLHAMNSAQQSTLAQKARVTMSLGLATSISANCLLQLATKQVLDVFGSSYAEQAAWCLRILLLAAFPLIIKYHYIAICRIHDKLAGAMLGMLPGGLLELGAAALGAHVGGLKGLSVGWVAAIYLESLFMFRTVFKTMRSLETSVRLIEQLYPSADAIWLIDTSPLPAIRQCYMGADAIWLIDTSLLPAMRLSDLTQASRETGMHEMSPRQYETDRRSSGAPHRLKPPRLQRYTPYHDGTCIIRSVGRKK